MEIRIRSVFHNQKGSILKLIYFDFEVHKKNYCDIYYDIPSKIEMIIVLKHFKVIFLLFSAN